MVAALIPGRQDLRAVMARGFFSARRHGDIWFRETIRMENAVLGRVFHMNNAEKTAKRIGKTRFAIIFIILQFNTMCLHMSRRLSYI